MILDPAATTTRAAPVGTGNFGLVATIVVLDPEQRADGNNFFMVYGIKTTWASLCSAQLPDLTTLAA